MQTDQTETKEKIIKNIITTYRKNRKIFSCKLEITSKCNFFCPHCYINNSYDYISCVDIIDYLDQMKQLDVYYLIITGGEPMLHPDFEKIYTYAFKKGFSIGIYTNLSLLNSNLIELFKKYPPRYLEITIYGITNETYQKFSRKPNTFDLINRNINKLKNNNINFRLKSVTIEENYNEYSKIKAYCESLCDNFRADSEILPARDGKDSNLKHSIHKTNNLENIQSNDFSYEKLKEIYLKKQSNKLFHCDAGLISCTIISDNTMKICNFADFSNESLNKKSIKEIWDIYEKYHSKKLDKNSKCYNCKYINFCTNCPVKSYYASNKKSYQLIPIEEQCINAKRLYSTYINKKNKKAIFSLCVDALDRNKIIKGKIYGNSMLPTLKPNTTIYVKRARKYEVGDIVAFPYKNKGFFVAHRILRIDKDNYFIEGDNAKGQGSLIEKDSIVGKLVKYEK